MGQVPGRAQAAPPIMEAQGACPPPPPRKHFATQRRRPGVMCVGGVCTLVARARTRPAPSVCVGVGVGGRAARVAEQGANPHPPTHHHRHHQTHTHTHTHTHTRARDTTPPPAYSPSVRVRVRSAFWWLAGASGLQSCVPQSAADCSSPGCDANSSTAGVQRHLALRTSPSMTLIAGAPQCSSQKPTLARRARPCTPLR